MEIIISFCLCLFYLPPFFFRLLRLILVMEISTPHTHTQTHPPHLLLTFFCHSVSFSSVVFLLMSRSASPPSHLPKYHKALSLACVLLSESLINTVERPVGVGVVGVKSSEVEEQKKVLSTASLLSFLSLSFFFFDPHLCPKGFSVWRHTTCKIDYPQKGFDH